MIRKEGIHLYINIVNYNDMIEAEEGSTGNLTRVIHSLNTYFSMLETYAKGVNENVTIEKITGSRLHLYLLESNEYNSLDIIWKVSIYARSLTMYLIKEVGKYRNLPQFIIQTGACKGDFFEYEFNDQEYSELTTIGYAANFAAKLQSITSSNCLSISKNMYDLIESSDIKGQFVRRTNNKLTKYNQDCYFEILLRESSRHFQDEIYLKTFEFANKKAFCDMEINEVRTKVDFDSLNVSNCKKVFGIPLFADVRDFTSKFNSDDSNLSEMKDKTTKILKEMYKTVIESDGVHVQFQGDREFALFNDYRNFSSVNIYLLYCIL